MYSISWTHWSIVHPEWAQPLHSPRFSAIWIHQLKNKFRNCLQFIMYQTGDCSGYYLQLNHITCHHKMLKQKCRLRDRGVMISPIDRTLLHFVITINIPMQFVNRCIWMSICKGNFNSPTTFWKLKIENNRFGCPLHLRASDGNVDRSSLIFERQSKIGI